MQMSLPESQPKSTKESRREKSHKRLLSSIKNAGLLEHFSNPAFFVGQPCQTDAQIILSKLSYEHPPCCRRAISSGREETTRGS